jgi:hypothetical protein
MLRMDTSASEEFIGHEIAAAAHDVVEHHKPMFIAVLLDATMHRCR